MTKKDIFECPNSSDLFFMVQDYIEAKGYGGYFSTEWGEIGEKYNDSLLILAEQKWRELEDCKWKDRQDE